MWLGYLIKFNRQVEDIMLDCPMRLNSLTMIRGVRSEEIKSESWMGEMREYGNRRINGEKSKKSDRLGTGLADGLTWQRRRQMRDRIGKQNQRNWRNWLSLLNWSRLNYRWKVVIRSNYEPTAVVQSTESSTLQTVPLELISLLLHLAFPFVDISLHFRYI